MKYFITFFSLLFFSISLGQERKIIELKRFKSPPKIDGILDDTNWKTLVPGTKFERYMPNNGSSEKEGAQGLMFSN